MTTPSFKTFVKVYIALMALLALSVGLSFVPLGLMQTPAALLIALAKASLVVLFFMEVMSESGAVRIWVVAGFYWLAILLALSMADYLSRR